VVVGFAGNGDGETEFSVRAEKEVRENVTADSETVESAVLDRLTRVNREQDPTGAGEYSGQEPAGAGECSGQDPTGAGEHSGQDTTGAGEHPGQDIAGASRSTDTREVAHPEDLPSGRRAALLFLGLSLPLISGSAALLGSNAVEAIASGSFARLLLFLGLYLIWIALVGGVGILVTWYYEGTLRQRLPL
jgi:hypothetical protein